METSTYAGRSQEIRTWLWFWEPVLEGLWQTKVRHALCFTFSFFFLSSSEMKYLIYAGVYDGNSPEQWRSFGIKDDGYSAARLQPLYRAGTEMISGNYKSNFQAFTEIVFAGQNVPAIICFLCYQSHFSFQAVRMKALGYAKMLLGGQRQSSLSLQQCLFFVWRMIRGKSRHHLQTSNPGLVIWMSDSELSWTFLDI